MSLVKILKIKASSKKGGGSQVMWSIVKKLKDDFKFYILSPNGFFIKKYKRNKITTKILEGSFLNKIIKIRKEIKKIKPDIIHVHGTRAAFWARLAIIGIKDKPKLIYTLHGFHIIRKKFLLKWPLIVIEKFLNRWTDVLVCVGKDDKKLVQKYKVASQNIKVIKNGINVSKFKKPKQEIINTKKQELGIKNKFIVSSICRLHSPKDVSTIIEAFNKIVAKYPNIVLLIIGDGPLRKELETKVEKLNLEDNIYFLGFQDNSELFIHLSDIVVLSTNWEGLPLIPLEVGASKKPIIASNVGGVKETIKNQKTGLLFNKGDGVDLSKKIIRLYKNERLRKKIGDNAYNYIKKEFSRKRMVKKYTELYNNLY